mmetsp:Transcript_5413/g.4091  ORF Transcript_5413/g.4091 Transcript_5413/m.4091 type:complete len:103 (-) Transcript_5413:814-1122(-)
MTSVGNILDAQDQYGQWHLSIVLEEKAKERRVHFLEFPNPNRDEQFREEDSARIAPAFTQTEIPPSPEVCFDKLRQHLEDHRALKKSNGAGVVQQKRKTSHR